MTAFQFFFAIVTGTFVGSLLALHFYDWMKK